jgi:hypothetical protein
MLYTRAGNDWNDATCTNSYAFVCGPPILVILGCTNDAASNYDPVATTDDRSCIFDACAANQFYVEYFENTDFSGVPALTQCEDSAAHDWSADGMASGENPLGGTGAFSVRWHGSFDFRAGQYRFKTASDDGSRLFVDGELVMDRTGLCCRGTSDPVELTDGSHFVTFEFVESSGHAYSDLHWEEEAVQMCFFDAEPFSFDGTNHVDVPYAMTGFPSSSSFSVSFIMTVDQEPTGDWRNVLHIGSADGERTPAIWLSPGAMTLHARVTTAAAGNGGIDASSIGLVVGEPTHVTYVMAGTHLSLYVNGVLSDEYDDGTEAVVVEQPMYIGADPWYTGFLGSMQKVCLMSGTLSADEVAAKYASDMAEETATDQLYGRCIFGKDGPEFNGVDHIILPYATTQFPDADGSFAVSFVMRLDQSFTGAYRNVLHIGAQDDHRTPAIWLNTQDNSFLVIISTESGNHAGPELNPDWQIPIGEEVHVVYVMDGTVLSFYINGELALTLDNGSPAHVYQDMMYLGDDPWYDGFRGGMHSLCLHDDPLTAGQVSSLHTHDMTSHDFLLVTTAMAWPAARAECQSLGRDLASVHSSAENDEIASVMADGHVWIGGTDASCPSTVNECWAWSDHSAFEYNNWARGEPNGAREDCAMLYTRAGNDWNDATCTNSYAFVCGAPQQASSSGGGGGGH